MVKTIGQANPRSQAVAQLEKRVEGVDSALEQLQLGNDYICHGAQMVSQLFAREGQTVEL